METIIESFNENEDFTEEEQMIKDKENNDKMYIKKSLEKRLAAEFNQREYHVHTLEKKIDKKPCILFCCLPFTIIFSPCLCYLHRQHIKHKKEEEQKYIDQLNKNFELKQTKQYQIEFIEKKIKNYKSDINKMNRQIPITMYKIELLDEKLTMLKQDK